MTGLSVDRGESRCSVEGCGLSGVPLVFSMRIRRECAPVLGRATAPAVHLAPRVVALSSVVSKAVPVMSQLCPDEATPPCAVVQ